jgi:diguanylate cyclase (GGDEF)-like protein/PAS domain S-box-containing protein
MIRHPPQEALIGIRIAHQADRILLAEFLKQTGYGVQILTAVDMAQLSTAVSLIVIDEPSARRKGELLLDLKKRARPYYLPVLMTLTGGARATPWLHAGCDDVLRLPLNKEELLARLDAFLRLRRYSEEAFRESARLFHATFDIAPVGIVHIGLDGKILMANQRWCQMTGYTEDEMSSLTAQHLLMPDEEYAIPSVIKLLSEAGPSDTHYYDKRYRRKDGSTIWSAVAICLLRGTDEKPKHLIAAVEDITERKQMEQALRESERFIRSTLDALSKHICVIDAEGRILAVNKAWREFALANGAPPDTVWENVNYLAVCDRATGIGGDEAHAFAAGIRAVVRGERKEFSIEYTCHSPAEKRWFIARVTRFPEDGPSRLVVAHYNVTKTKVTEQHLAYLAHYDSLTGLPNRELLRDRLHQAIAHADRYKHSVWVISVDIDRFKRVNDTIGLKGGDTVLELLARRLRASLRDTDTLARFGGDKFVMVLPGEAEESLVSCTLQRIVAAVSESLTVDENEFVLSCSAGVAVYPDDGSEPEKLIEHADIAMHRAKELGRKNYQFYTPSMNESALERLRMERDLRHALEHDEFALHYQPQVDLRTGCMVGMEALLRWRHPERGLVPPNEFIGLAEETGLIVPIGAWVLRTACMQNMAWQGAGLGELRIAVNLSARQFSQKNLTSMIASVLQETGLPPHCLDLELTESLVMTDVEHAIGVLNDLRMLGVQLSIDDFGTGYSSLSYLKRFPIDVLKIDQSFVRAIAPNSNDAAISDAIVSMAHSLGIKVIAEGVETEAECEFLSRNMCDEIQGFLFSKPLPAEEVEALWREGRRLPEHLLRLHKPPRTLLLVDDEPNILAALKRLVRRDGYQVFSASSGREGLELLARHEVDVIVSDQRMPGMTGVEFLRTVKTLHPETVRIVLSGFTELQSVTDAVNEGAIYKFLTKPWEDKQLREHIAEAFQHKEMADENQRLNLEVRSANQELAKANRQLEELLQQKQQQIKRGEVSLDVVREALLHVSQPVIGLDDDDLVAFVNIAAQNLFSEAGPVLGIEAAQFMPQVLDAIHGVSEAEKCEVELRGMRFDVVSRSMGHGTESRGKLITLTSHEATVHG